MSVADVVLRLDGDGDGLRVRIESPAGRTSAPFELPPELWIDFVGESVWPGDDLRPRGQERLLVTIPRRSSMSSEKLGERLYRALFPPPVQRLFERSQGMAERLRLRLEWDLMDPRIAPLHRLPWELLRDPEGAGSLALDRRSTLMRQTDVSATRRSLPQPLALRVLAMASNPRGLSRLDLATERDRLLEIAAQDASLDVIPVSEGIDLLTLRRLLGERGSHVLHFMGHGEMQPDGQGCLFFETVEGRPLPVSGEALAQTLEGLPELRLVVLNACRSAEIRTRPFAGVASALIRGGLPAVVAMQAPIADDAAIAFSHELYRRLARAEPLDLAVCEARHAIHALDPESLEWAIPVLFARDGDRPLFESGLPTPPTPACDEDELLDRYLAWMIEETRELDPPWLPDAGVQPRFELEALYSLLRHDPTPPTEHARSRAALEREVRQLEDLLGVRDLSPEEEYLQVWRHLRHPAQSAPGSDDFSPRVALSQAGEGASSWNEVFCRHRRIVLLGEAGSGKTCMLRWLARRLAEAAPRSSTESQRPKHLWVAAREVDPRRDDTRPVDLGPARIPILLDVATYAERRRENPGVRLAEHLGHHLGSSHIATAADARGRQIDPTTLHAFLLRELAAGRAVVLLDGLDQVVDPRERREMIQEIEAFLDAYLPPPKASMDTGGGQAVITSRPVGYRQAAFGEPAVHFTLEPLEACGLARFCQRWAEILPAAASASLVDAIATLRARGAGDLVANPLLVTVLAAVLRRAGGQLPRRRLDLYEPAVTILLERWEGLARHQGASGMQEPRVRRLLAELAAQLHDRRASFGLISRRRLSHWLAERLGPEDATTIDWMLYREVGPLVPYGGGVYGFLHRAFQEYLAACWLASDAELAPQRLEERLSDPVWRAPSAMALGLLAEQLDPAAFDNLLRRLLSAKTSFQAHPVLYADLLLLDALPEIASAGNFEAQVEATARRLLDRAVAEGDGPCASTIEPVLAALISGSAGKAAVRALSAAVSEAREAGQRDVVAEIAKVALSAPEVPYPLAEALQRAQTLDRPPWPIDRSLRFLLAHDRAALPSPRASLRRVLARDADIAERVRRHPGWRRLILAVHGGGPDGPEPYRISNLDHAILEALRSDRSLQSLVPILRRRAAGRDTAAADARVALISLGERVVLPDGMDRRSFAAELDRALIGLGDLDARIPDLLLLLAASAPRAERVVLFGHLWRRLLWHRTEERDPRHRLAVLLDVYGALLTNPLSVFVDSWLAAGGELPAETMTDRLAATLDVLARIPDAFDFVRAWALAVLRPLLETHDLLTEAVLLAEVSLSDRLAARSEARSRLLGRDARPLSDQDMLRRAEAIRDPWRRFRALRWIALGVAALRSQLTVNRLAPDRILLGPISAAVARIRDPRRRALADASIIKKNPSWPSGARLDETLRKVAHRLEMDDPGPAADAPLLKLLSDEALERDHQESSVLARHGISFLDPLFQDSSTLDGLVNRLDADEDLTRLQAALTLHGDRTSLRRRWPARRVGLDFVLQLARHWLRRKEDDPRGALILRWTFQVLEHDSPVLLQQLSELLATPGIPGMDADAAEIALRHLEVVDIEAAGVLGDILRQGPARAQRAVVESLPNVLTYGGMRADAVWSEVSTSLACAAEAFGNARVGLVGPVAVVEAAERAWAERGRVDDAVIKRARELCAATRVPWADLLRGDLKHLRATLEAIGQQRRVGRHSKGEIEAATERIVSQPILLQLLVAWLEVRLWQDIERTELDDHMTSNLLELVAAGAMRLPRAYFEATAERSLWRRRLCDAVESCDWLRARRAAVELLGLERKLGEEELMALSTALLDGPEVQRAVLASLARIRRLEHLGVLARVEAELTAPRASRAFAAGRLLAALARPAHCDPELRQRIETTLATAASKPDARRPVYVATFDDCPFSRAAGFECLGRLDRLLRGLLLDIQGVPEPFHLAEPTKSGETAPC